MSSYIKKNWTKIVDWVFGYDLFISYSRRSWGEGYALRLADQLRSQPYDFRVFLDTDELRSGLPWNVQGERALRKSSRIYLLATPGIVDSEGVKAELCYNDSLGDKKKTVGLIDIQGALASIRVNHQEFANLLPDSKSLNIDEPNDEEPSPHVVEKIKNDFDLTREATKRNGVLISALGLLMALSIASIIGIISYWQAELKASLQEQLKLTSQSIYLADKAKEQLEQNDSTASILLSLEGLPEKVDGNTGKDRPLISMTEASMYSGLFNNQQTGFVPYVFSGEADKLPTIFSPAGDRIVTRYGLWNSKNWKFIKTDREIFVSAIFSKDGKTLYTTSGSGPIRAWNAKTGQHLYDFSASNFSDLKLGHSGEIIAYNKPGPISLLSPDDPQQVKKKIKIKAREIVVPATLLSDAGPGSKGQRLLLLNEERNENGSFWSVALWDTYNQKPVLDKPLLVYRGGSPPKMWFSPDGIRVFVEDYENKQLKIWLSESGKSERSISCGNKTVSDVAFTDDSLRIGVLCQDEIKVLDLTSRQLLKKFKKKTSGLLNTLSLRGDGKYIAIGGRYGQVWNVESGDTVLTTPGKGYYYSRFTFHPNLPIILSNDSKGNGHIWSIHKTSVITDLDHGSPSRRDIVHAKNIYGGKFDRTGQYILTWTKGAGIFVWNAQTGEKLWSIADQKNNSMVACFLNNSDKILVGSSDGTLKLYNWKKAEKAVTLWENTRVIERIACHPNQDVFATSNKDNTFSIWDLNTLKNLFEEKHGSRVVDIHFSVDGSKVLSAERWKNVFIWDLHSYKKLCFFEEEDKVNSARFDASGKYVITTADEGTTNITDLSTCKHKLELLDMHQAYDAAFHPNLEQTLVVSGGRDTGGNIYLARVGERAMPLLVFEAHRSYVRHLEFSPDGHSLLTISDDKALIWRVFHDTESLTNHAKTTIPRCLTQAQRKQFHLSPEPPRWCITGFGPGIKTNDPSTWKPKWPYHMAAWKKWQLARDRGEVREMPKE